MAVTGIFGQTPAYLHYDVGDGLPGNVVYCAAQDERGFMWFGTDKGLACFDGTRFLVYGVKDGLPDPEVLNLKLDTKGRMWISSFRRKPCYRLKSQIFTEKNDIVLNSINLESSFYQFYESKNGAVWFTGNTSDLFCMKNTELKKLSIPESVFYVVEVDNKIYALNKSYFYLLSGDNKFDKIADIGFKDLETVLTGVVQYRNKLLLSIGNSIYLFEISGNEVKKVGEKKGLSGTLYIDRRNRFWVSSTKFGVVCFNNEHTDLTNPEFFLTNEKVNAVFEDSQQTMWFCTAGSGLFSLPKGSSSIYTIQDGLHSNNITAIGTNRDGMLIAGDNQGYVYEVEHSVRKIADLGNGSPNRTRHLNCDSIGNIYAVSDFGAAHIKGNTIEKVPNTRSAKYMLPTSSGLFIGMASHLQLFRTDEPVPQVIIPKRTTAILQDQEGYIWVGGIDGLYSSRDSFHFNLSDSFPLLKGRIVDLECGIKGFFWVVTPEYGAMQVKTSQGKILSIAVLNDRLETPIENVQSLFYQENGLLWLATNSGIYGLKEQRRIFHFDRFNGLPDNDVNMITVIQDTVWAGTISGLSKIVLNRNDQQIQFRTVFASLSYRIGDKSKTSNLEDSIITIPRCYLPAEASLIELRLAGLDYTSRGNMQYKCIIRKKLPEFLYITPDNIWNWVKNGFNAGTDTSLLSGNVLNFGVSMAPGLYDIWAMAINSSGIESNMPVEMELVKIPAWYQSIWFYLMLWGGIGFVVWRVFRGMLEYRKMQTAVSELRLQALQSQINPHFIGNSINAIQQFFFPPDPIKASEYISIFTRLLRTTMDFSEKHFVPLHLELEYIEDYLQMIHLRFGNRFHYSVNIKDDISENVLIPTMLLQPILENATIHGLSPDEISVLEISMIKTKEGQLICSITDNGVGISHSKAHKKDKQSRHKSKGLTLLLRKIKTLNDLYGIGCILEVLDLSDLHSDQHGTQVILSYHSEKIVVHPD